ncbi:MAG: glycogen debranching N-terminal domain-containing protein [Armatimonadota bacterium]|nr:glycogen debranching N-terminal domain-containing protein [Armatimonadota bacterium]MDR7453151.1 glycogen debranching N-terminal domain-containing protein [Armatimonadota bacterium]MDR7495997.1 glycogen debranching N-terminal domain-containing protein [Armatimonadota bacterium]MDR7510902.1 glycogen debranching N-terminal domain-containing protein [Armatimonadota bacterium]
MSSRIQLGPPRLTLAEGSSLFVTSPAGEIDPRAEQGFFVRDTRLLSAYGIRIDRQRWLLVSSAPVTHYAARLYFVNPPVEGAGARIRRNTLALRVATTLRGGVHQDLDVTNHGQEAASFTLAVEAGCDFRDLFEVRGLQPARRRAVRTIVEPRTYASTIRWLYERQDFRRGLVLRVARADSPPRVSRRGVEFAITLPPRRTWHACLHLLPVLGERRLDAPVACDLVEIEEIERDRRTWYASVAGCVAANEDVARAYRQAVEDITVLRLCGGGDLTTESCVVAAGVPWFATLFGRDSLIVGLQTLPVTAQVAPAVLRALGALQATERDDWRDAQPGKIPHEIRHGELAHFGEVPHSPYYGTADATTLFLIALHEAYRWTGDRQLVEALLPSAARALEWIDRHGDLDGDGFQEYERRSPRGIRHQGWKDSGDAVVDEHGRDVAPPVALVELQGYVYDAWRRMAEVYEALGDSPRARALREAAQRLRARFAETFWWPEERTYYFALDGAKRPVRSVVSNAGHALWSGIALPEHAHGVVARLMASDMFSGWGIRTLSSRHAAFNPFGYQVGAVWPHDNSLIALGFRRYGRVAEALAVAKGLFEAAAHFQAHQLPELFAGLQRGPRSFPVQYLEANIPQGWAAGSVFALLRMILGVRADAPRGRLLIDPALPDWLPRLRLTGMTLGPARFDLDVVREHDRTQYDVTVHEGQVAVVEEPWSPGEI